MNSIVKRDLSLIGKIICCTIVAILVAFTAGLIIQVIVNILGHISLPLKHFASNMWYGYGPIKDYNTYLNSKLSALPILFTGINGFLILLLIVMSVIISLLLLALLYLGIYHTIMRISILKYSDKDIEKLVYKYYKLYKKRPSIPSEAFNHKSISTTDKYLLQYVLKIVDKDLPTPILTEKGKAIYNTNHYGEPKAYMPKSKIIKNLKRYYTS